MVQGATEHPPTMDTGSLQPILRTLPFQTAATIRRTTAVQSLLLLRSLTTAPTRTWNLSTRVHYRDHLV